jgi:Zn-finger nucleic acid-binding protein
VKCPTDQETLVITERQGIEIDYCPRCRGVWLDRGELDKLIEREADRYESGRSRGDREDSGPFRKEWDRDRDRDDDDDRHRGHGTKRKKKGFLSEMFEFGE